MYIRNIFKRYKLKIEGNQIYDPIRKKYVALTPEEQGRQQMIKFLIQRLKVPVDRIGVERTLHSLGITGNWKRIDICIYGPNDEIIALIECKADDLGMWESAYMQVIDYAESLKVRNYFVVDAWGISGYHYVYERNQYDPIGDIPNYEQMLHLD